MATTFATIQERFPQDIAKLQACIDMINACTTFDAFVKASAHIESAITRPLTQQVAINAMMARAEEVGVNLCEE